ncbi:phosphatidylinositol transfer protein csr1 [Dipsacomyces acuminosporus]|nr:phosphatidylinositol transfer protein csr1 [Dipsacomyces acuminosporus]
MPISQASILQEYASRIHPTEERFGYLTAEEQRKVAKLWSLLLGYLDSVKGKPVRVVGELLQRVDRDWSALSAHEGLSDEEPEEVTRRAWRLSKSDSGIRRFGIRSKKPKMTREDLALDRHVNETTQQYVDRVSRRRTPLIPETFLPSFEHVDTETRDLGDTFWRVVSSKVHPDIWIHRYLRVSSWDVDRAFAAIKSVVEWRAAEAVDLLNFQGEVETGYDELRLGISRLVGRDRLGFPLMYVKVRSIMPRPNESFVHKRLLITAFEALQAVTRTYCRVTMLYDFTGFCMDNTPLYLVHFMVLLGLRQYADTTSVLLLLVDNWLFSNFWNLVRPFLDANLSSRIIFVKNVEEVKKFIDEDQIPAELGGKNTFALDYVPPKEGENAPMFDTEGRRAAEKEWRKNVAAFAEATAEWCSQLAASNNSTADRKDPVAARRDAAAADLSTSELSLSRFTRARNIFERRNCVDDAGCLIVP